GPVCELSNFLKAYLGGGTFQGRRLLESSSIAEMLIPQRNDRGEEFSTGGHGTPQNIGLGWHLDGSEEMRSCYHLGGGAGYRSELRIYPSLRYGIGVMGNETSYDTAAITEMIVSGQHRERRETELARHAQEGRIS